ncbi:sensor histidine kinase [Hoyosella sp. G463]|uniref:Sensor histidine kinase n=1 Tax=Lolliginicoccus lacisalsi TaxID=2742202 RepID=A0A927JB87_9ACTN|nr:sensor histidine kinase [Lolliginicoccus lacisalsi]
MNSASRATAWWRSRSPVERITVYMVWPWYLVLWMIPLLWVSTAWFVAPRRDWLLSALVMVVLLGVATVVFHGGMQQRIHPDSPVTRAPWRWATVLLFVAAVHFAVLALVGEGDEDWVLAHFWSGIFVVSIALGPLLRQRMLGVVALAGAGAALVVAGTVGLAVAAAVLALVMVLLVHSTLWPIDVMRQLEESRAREAALSVAEERLRFSRDVHDVVGRALSTIAIKSELAAKLADRGDPASAAQMREVEGIAHESLRSVRELVRGYRTINLDQEVRGARELLESAGIATTVEGGSQDVPELARESAAWVVREAVTNILRHSHAGSCRIVIGVEGVAITNDGAAAGSRATEGVGLTGLRERLTTVGGELSIRRSENEFTVAARFPGSRSTGEVR